jgi:hypothetical protein
MIVEICCLIIDPCMFYNLSVPFISWNLVWFRVRVAGITLNVHLCSSCSLFFLGFDPFPQKKINFCVFDKFNLFLVWFLFLAFFSGQTHTFGLVHVPSTKDLWLTRSNQLSQIKIESMDKALFGYQCFC